MYYYSLGMKQGIYISRVSSYLSITVNIIIIIINILREE